MRTLLRAACSAAMLCAAAPCQWPSSASTNLPVADGAGEQVLPKLGLCADGSCYVGWFDSRNGAYEVRLQRLSPAGVEQWPHNGIVVSNQPQSTSLVDWDLIADSDGGCVLTFTDTRAGGDLDVYAYRFDAAGAPLWGPNGVAVSNNPDYEPNPRVVEASDGDFVFAWANTGPRTLQVQRLDRAGVPRFAGDGVAYAGDVGATPAFVQMVASDNGSVILTWMRTISFSGARHLHAQKFDAAGAAQWNGGVRLPIFDQTSVPIAHQHKMAADGLGGAFVSWHFAQGLQFFARVQHLDAQGVELFAHNGVDLSATTDSCFDPAMAVDPATQTVIAFWNQRNQSQSAWGISAQRLDPVGGRMWGPTGVTLVPVGAVNFVAPVAAPFCGGAFGFVLEQSLGGQASALRAFALDGNGSALLAGPRYASTHASDKLRLVCASTASGAATLAWTDLRTAGGDLFMQAFDAGGGLAPAVSAVEPYGCGVNVPDSLVAIGRPSLCGTFALGVDNPAATQNSGSLPLIALSAAPLPNFPCGVLLPGYGMSSNGAAGELLIDTAQVAVTYVLPPWSGPGTPSLQTISIPFDPAFAGVALYAQGALLDFASGAPTPLGLAGAVRLTIGY